MGGMRRRSLFLAPAVAALACLVPSACTGGTADRAVPPAKPVTAPATASPSGVAGSAGHPMLFGCAEESFLGGGSSVPQRQ